MCAIYAPPLGGEIGVPDWHSSVFVPHKTLSLVPNTKADRRKNKYQEKASNGEQNHPLFEKSPIFEFRILQFDARLVGALVAMWHLARRSPALSGIAFVPIAFYLRFVTAAAIRAPVLKNIYKTATSA